MEMESLAMKLLPCSTNQAPVNRKDEKCKRRNQARIIKDSWEHNLMLSFLQKEKKKTPYTNIYQGKKTASTFNPTDNRKP